MGSFGCCGKMPHTEWLIKSGIFFFLIILGTVKSKIKALAHRVSQKDLLPHSQTTAFPLCSNVMNELSLRPFL